jgi:hypothetical protein
MFNKNSLFSIFFLLLFAGSLQAVTPPASPDFPFLSLSSIDRNVNYQQFMDMFANSNKWTNLAKPGVFNINILNPELDSYYKLEMEISGYSSDQDFETTQEVSWGTLTKDYDEGFPAPDWDDSIAYFIPAYLGSWQWSDKVGEGQNYSFFRLKNVKLFCEIEGRQIAVPEATGIDFTATVDQPTNAIIGKNPGTYDSYEILHSKYPENFTLTIQYPSVFYFKGLSAKFGVKFFAMTCPDRIIVKIVRKAPYSNQGLVLDNDIIIEAKTGVIGFIKSYSGGTLLDAVGAVINTSGEQPVPLSTQKDWVHAYYLEYHWDEYHGDEKTSTVIKYSELIYPTSVAYMDTSFAIYYSQTQSIFETTPPELSL